MKAGAKGTVWRIDPSALRPARLGPPLSKSDLQRALVLAHILRRPDWVIRSQPLAEQPADVQAMARGLAALASSGASQPVDIDCGDGGAPFRLLLAQASTTPGARVRFWGSARLGQRPHRPLIDSLRAALGPAGLSIREGNPWPIEVEAVTGSAEPRFSVNPAQSSQFVTSLLLAAAALHQREKRPWTVELTGPTASLGYLDLTLRWLQRAGFALERGSTAVVIGDWKAPSGPAAIPGDWSSIAYLLLVAWRARGSVADVDFEAEHPDRAVVGILEGAGLSLAPNQSGDLEVRGTLRSGVRASGAGSPDLLPTVAALACVAPSPSSLFEADILRGKESDRLEGIVGLVRAFSGTARLTPNAIEIEPPHAFPALTRFDSQGDHRLAMSAAVLSILSGAPLDLVGPECVAKSFPGFWDQLRAAGVRCAAVN